MSALQLAQAPGVQPRIEGGGVGKVEAVEPPVDLDPVADVGSPALRGDAAEPGAVGLCIGVGSSSRKMPRAISIAGAPLTVCGLGVSITVRRAGGEDSWYALADDIAVRGWAAERSASSRSSRSGPQPPSADRGSTAPGLLRPVRRACCASVRKDRTHSVLLVRPSGKSRQLGRAVVATVRAASGSWSVRCAMLARRPASGSSRRKTTVDGEDP
jgi:hypothetical protein